MIIDKLLIVKVKGEREDKCDKSLLLCFAFPKLSAFKSDDMVVGILDFTCW